MSAALRSSGIRASTARRRWVLVMLVMGLSGCAFSVRATEGPVTVVLGDSASTARQCVRLTGEPRAVWCMTRFGPAVTIYCPMIKAEGLAECLAHEIRHVLEPAWRHE